MKKTTIVVAFLALVAAVILANCGGGGGGTDVFIQPTNIKYVEINLGELKRLGSFDIPVHNGQYFGTDLLGRVRLTVSTSGDNTYINLNGDTALDAVAGYVFVKMTLTDEIIGWLNTLDIAYETPSPGTDKFSSLGRHIGAGEKDASARPVDAIARYNLEWKVYGDYGLMFGSGFYPGNTFYYGRLKIQHARDDMNLILQLGSMKRI